jgi:hypothetical protein
MKKAMMALVLVGVLAMAGCCGMCGGKCAKACPMDKQCEMSMAECGKCPAGECKCPKAKAEE